MQQDNFHFTRKINAPRELVFAAFANAEALAQWWGPKDMPLTVKKFEFRPAGKFHFRLDGSGQVMWAVFTYIRISSPALIEFINSFSDEEGNVCESPFGMPWPLEVLTTIEFSESNGVTTVSLNARPVNATAEQTKTYTDFTQSMQEGFGASFIQLDTYLCAGNPKT